MQFKRFIFADVFQYLSTFFYIRTMALCLFSGGNIDNTFSIDPENGNILLARPLDWETHPEYNVTVNVTDMVYTVQSWVGYYGNHLATCSYGS